jgi:hypothetical protein
LCVLIVGLANAKMANKKYCPLNQCIIKALLIVGGDFEKNFGYESLG